MCLRSSIDRFAIPCIYEVEGITTMPVCCHFKIQPRSVVNRTDCYRYLVVAALPAWSVETPYGSFPANAAHSVVHLSIDLAIFVRSVFPAVLS